MDLDATRMFVAVVRANSLSAAATRLGTPFNTEPPNPGPGAAT